MLIREPSLLAQLPSLGAREPENIYVSQVHGLQGSQKRKRFEVVAAVHGEAVLIYNIQAPKLLCSYAVPPQTTFTCKPCSVRLHHKNGGIVRRTFCALQRSELELHSFLDCSAEQIPSSQRIELRDSKSPIIYLETIPSNAESNSDEECVNVLAVHEDGSMEVLSGDLQSRRLMMSSMAMGKGQGPITVKAASLISFDVAQKCLLKDRGDIVAELSKPSSSGEIERSVLLMITTLQGPPKDHPSQLQIRIFTVPHVGVTAPKSLSSEQAVELFNSALPDSEASQMTSDFQAEFHSTTGTLSLRGGSDLVTYGSLAFSPRVLSRFDQLQAECSSFQHLNSHLLVEASTTGLTIFDTKYQTVQAKLDAARILQKVWKKNVAAEENLRIHILSYHSRLSSVLARIGQSIVSFELVKSSSAGRVARDHGISLLDAINQGASQLSTRIKPSEAHTMTGFAQPSVNNGCGEYASWTSGCFRMDKFVRERDVTAFEESMAFHLRGSKESETAIREIQGLKLPSNHAFIDRIKIDYALSKIFQARKSDDGPDAEINDLHIEFLPPRLLQWLIDSNYVTSANVRRAIYGPGKQRLPHPCVAPALIHCDSSLQWLCEYLHGSPTIDLPDLVSVLNLLVADAMVALLASPKPSKMLTDGENKTRPQDPEELIDVGSENDPANTSSISQVSQSKPHVFEEARINALRLAVQRLQRCPKESITTTIQSRLTQEQIIALVQFLRHELFIAGHTSHFRQQSDNLVANGRSIELGTVVRMIACSIDALGPVSFVASVVDDSFFGTLIADLREEISAALAGVEEAMYLQGLLREVLRFGTSAVKHNVQRYSGSAESLKVSKIKSQKPGTIVTIYSEPTDDQGDPNATSGMLPLSLQADELVSNMKRKAGGQMSRRSVREKAYLHRQREVGKYSFDRLML